MRILLATGGSGGHMFPALRTALALKARGHEVVFAGALAAFEAKITDEGFACRCMDAAGLNVRTPWGLAAWMAAMTVGDV